MRQQLRDNMNQFITSVACLVLIDYENLIFITQRPMSKKLGGFWEFPGGKIEIDESPENALRREIQEELKLNLGILKAMHPVCHDYDFGRIQLHPFLARCDDQPQAELLEHSASLWVPFDKLKVFTLAPADIPILDQIESILNGTY